MGSADVQKNDNNTPPVNHRRVVVTTDGMCTPNPGKTRIGVIVETGEGEILQLVSEDSGWGTSNTAEYSAIIRGLEVSARLRAQIVTVYTDSQLVERQLNGVYKVGNKTLRGYHTRAKKLESKFTRVRFRWHSREADRGPQADALAKGGKAAAEIYEQLAEPSRT